MTISNPTRAIGLEQMADLTNLGTWGARVNANLSRIDAAFAGTASVDVSAADVTLTTADTGDLAADCQTRMRVIQATSTSGVTARNVIWPAASVAADKGQQYVLVNATSPGVAVTFKVSGQPGITLPVGARAAAWCNGTDIALASTTLMGASIADAAGSQVVAMASGAASFTAGAQFGTSSTAAAIGSYLYGTSGVTVRTPAGFSYGVLSASNVAGTAFIATSDARLKSDLTRITAQAGLDFVRRITPYHFHWRDTGLPATGYMAQQLGWRGYEHLVASAHNPLMQSETTTLEGETVISPPGVQFSAVYDQVIPYLHAALLSALDRIAALEARIAALGG